MITPCRPVHNHMYFSSDNIFVIHLDSHPNQHYSLFVRTYNEHRILPYKILLPKNILIGLPQM